MSSSKFRRLQVSSNRGPFPLLPPTLLSNFSWHSWYICISPPLFPISSTYPIPPHPKTPPPSPLQRIGPWHSHKVLFHVKMMLLVVVDMHFVGLVTFSILLYIFEHKCTFMSPLSSILGTLSGRRGEEDIGSQNQLIVQYMYLMYGDLWLILSSCPKTMCLHLIKRSIKIIAGCFLDRMFH